MLKLPSSSFQQIFLFGAPEDAFSSHGVCKRFQKELHSDTFWKSMKKIHAPQAEYPVGIEAQFRAWSFPRLDFCLTIKKGDLVHEMKWDTAFRAYDGEIPAGPIADAIWKNVMRHEEAEYNEIFSFNARWRDFIGGDAVDRSREVQFDSETGDEGGAEGIDYHMFAEVGLDEMNCAYNIGVRIVREEEKVFVGVVWLSEPWVYLNRYLDNEDFDDFVIAFFND